MAVIYDFDDQQGKSLSNQSVFPGLDTHYTYTHTYVDTRGRASVHLFLYLASFSLVMYR